MNNLFENHGIFSGEMLHISPKETFELCKKGVVIVDVREDFMIGYKKFNVPLVLYFPLSEMNTNFNKLPTGKFLIFADAVGLRSKEAVILLIEKGFKHIANMAGGLVEWERDGLPLQVNSKEELSGQCPCQLRTTKK